MQHVTKLIVPAWTEIELLAQATELKWLAIEHITPEVATAEWLLSLKRLVRDRLQNLETLEFSHQAAVSVDNLLDSRTPIRVNRLSPASAHGQETLVDHLKKLMAEPDAYFQKGSIGPRELVSPGPRD